MNFETRNEKITNHLLDESLSSKNINNLDEAISSARDKLLEQQHDDGHWIYELV